MSFGIGSVPGRILPSGQAKLTAALVRGYAVEVKRLRMEERKRFADGPEPEGVPAEEGVEGTDVEERLEEDPDEVPNRRDVPDEQER